MSAELLVRFPRPDRDSPENRAKEKMSQKERQSLLSRSRCKLPRINPIMVVFAQRGAKRTFFAADDGGSDINDTFAQVPLRSLSGVG